MSVFHSLTMRSIAGDDIEFARFNGQMCLIVNVASK